MSSPALSLEATTIDIVEEIAVRASIEATFAALLDQLAAYNGSATWETTTAITGERFRRSRGRRCWKFAGHCLCPIR